MTNGTRRRWGVSVTPSPLFTPGKDPVPIVQEAVWCHRAGLDRCGKSRLPPGFDPRTVQPVAQSLYRLSYPVHRTRCNFKFNVNGSVYCNNILIYIQQDAMLHSLFYLETALHVSGVTCTHHQERIQLYLQHLVFVRPLLLPAVIAVQICILLDIYKKRL